MEKDNVSPNLSAEIFTVLKNRIMHWKYLPGHRLTYIGLSEEFGVSRSPIREVLQMLEEKGLIIKVPRIGYTVRQPDMDEIYELYEFRLAVESYIIERLAETGIDNQLLRDLHQLWQTFITKMHEIYEEAAIQDEHFHETLAKALGNSVLYQSVKEVNERLHFIRVNDITTPERWILTCKQHLLILDMIKQRDIEGARNSIKTNIQEGRENVDQAIKEALSRAYLKARERS